MHTTLTGVVAAITAVDPSWLFISSTNGLTWSPPTSTCSGSVASTHTRRPPFRLPAVSKCRLDPSSWSTNWNASWFWTIRVIGSFR